MALFKITLSEDETVILMALAEGRILKSHRYLDGTKVYELHPVDGGRGELVDGDAVHHLEEAQLIGSNQKFPAASYLLTEKGRLLAQSRLGKETAVLAARNW
jgi:hypothetical protein